MTNISALNAVAQGTFTQNAMSNSLQKLSSGLRINSARDDASGMAIADSLRSQGNALKQAIRNANDALGIIQIADKAMDEQNKVLGTIKVKATQAAQDGQTEATRKMIQADINRLIESLDNIAATTSYNGLTLLAGGFTNKEFQVGAYSHQSIGVSIGATSSDKIGHMRFESFRVGLLPVGWPYDPNEPELVEEVLLNTVRPTFYGVGIGGADVQLESVVISTSAGTGLGVLAEAINKNTEALGGIRANVRVVATGEQQVAGGDIKGLRINGVLIGDIDGIQQADRDGRAVAAINNKKEETGVSANIDEQGRMQLVSDGRAILVSDESGMGLNVNIALGNGIGDLTIGQIDLVREGPNDIQWSLEMARSVPAVDDYLDIVGSLEVAASATLRNVKGAWNTQQEHAMGAGAYKAWSDVSPAGVGTPLPLNTGGGVLSLEGAMAVMDIAESAAKQLNRIRSDLGSAQIALQSTINNITITAVNVKSAESNIREVDFASESAQYTNLNILAQSGNYALSQANTIMQGILRLLQ